MPGKRPKDGKPSVYATHLAGLLSGDKECKFAAWFKARYWYDKVEDTAFDRAGWTSDHTAMVQAERDRLVREGWVVSLESANKFDLEGKVGSIAGKPDIEAVHYADGQVVAVRIVDCKTGRQRNSDWMQVLLYLYAKLRKQPELRNVLVGVVLYKDKQVPVSVADLTDERIAQLGATMRDVCAEVPPTASPSQRECGYCDISAEHCVARDTGRPASVAVEDF